jgi:hypothetical protein
MPSEKYKKEERVIAEAVEAYKKDPRQKITKLAAQFNIPYARLRARIHGRPSYTKSYTERRPVASRLTTDQEDAIKLWVADIDDMGIPPTPRLVEEHANAILRRMNPQMEPPPTVSKRWPYRFMKRLGKEYKLIKQKPIDPKRFKAEDFATIAVWFDRLELTIKNNKITPSNIWNFDETGFIIGRGKEQSVITRFKEKARELPSDSNRESVTIIECISATGSIIPPMVILAGKNILEEWIPCIQDEDWRIAVSDSGYNNGILSYDWINHFHFQTKEQAGTGYRLLFLDNFYSHLTYDFLDFCHKHKIILNAFPAHTTHFLQPLDGVPFQQYKHFHGKVVNQYALLGSSTFDKVDFLYELKGFRTRALTQRTNRKGYSDRGIWPLNPDLITSKLRDKYGSDDEDVLQIYNGDEAPSPEIRSSPTNASFSPPDTAYDLQKRIKKVEKKLENLSEKSSSIRRDLTKIFRGSLSQAHIRHQHESHINRLITHHERKNKPRSRRQVKSGGVLSIKDANGIIDARKKAEMDAAWKKAQREAKRKTTTNPTPEQPQQAQDGWFFDPPRPDAYEPEIREYRAHKVISFDENIQL